MLFQEVTRRVAKILSHLVPDDRLGAETFEELMRSAGRIDASIITLAPHKRSVCKSHSGVELVCRLPTEREQGALMRLVRERTADGPFSVIVDGQTVRVFRIETVDRGLVLRLVRSQDETLS